MRKLQVVSAVKESRLEVKAYQWPLLTISAKKISDHNNQRIEEHTFRDVQLLLFHTCSACSMGWGLKVMTYLKRRNNFRGCRRSSMRGAEKTISCRRWSWSERAESRLETPRNSSAFNIKPLKKLVSEALKATEGHVFQTIFGSPRHGWILVKTTFIMLYQNVSGGGSESKWCHCRTSVWASDFCNLRSPRGFLMEQLRLRGLRKFAEQVVNAQWFDYVTGFIIFLNLITVGIELEMTLTDPDFQHLGWILQWSQAHIRSLIYSFKGRVNANQCIQLVIGLAA